MGQSLSYFEKKIEAKTKMMPLELHDDDSPVVKAYFKYELAKLYKVDVKTLVGWIERFIDQLRELGYHKNMKKLSPDIVRYIFFRLGEP